MRNMCRMLARVALVAGVISVGCAGKAYATMNLETDASVSGIAVALNNYYARTLEPEEALAESVKMVASDAIVLEDQGGETRNNAVEKLVKEVTPTQEKIVNEGEGGITWGTVKGTPSLRLRNAPNANAKTLTLLAEGEHYIVTGQDGQFLKIKVDDDLEGYVFKDYVDTSISYDDEIEQQKKELAAEAAKAKKEAAQALKALEEAKKAESAGATETAAKAETKAETKATKAETKAETKATKASDDVVEVLEIDDWEENEGDDSTVEAIEVEEDDDSDDVGLPEDDEDETEEEEEETYVEYGPGTGVSTATRNAMVAYAKQFLGNPYVYGGTSLTDGCDCSGFTMKVYEYFGKNIGRSSRDQAAKGKKISASDAQPGDLFFYDSNGTINHVAMYIGGGKVIHASSSTTGIIISNAYYRTPCLVCRFLD